MPGVFAQDDFTVTPRLTLSGSARVDRHNEFGTFVSPRVSALLRPAEPWTVRVSAGPRLFRADAVHRRDRGHRSRRASRRSATCDAERADNVSADVTWTRAPLEVTGDVLLLAHSTARSTSRETGRPDFPIEIVNADGPTQTRGTELIARYRREGFDVILTHMFLWSTEPNPDGRAGARCRSTRGIRRPSTCCKQIGPARIGFEVFYTGRQALDDNPYRDRGFPHVLFGGLIDWGVWLLTRLRQRGESRRRAADAGTPAGQADARRRWPLDGGRLGAARGTDS